MSTTKNNSGIALAGAATLGVLGGLVLAWVYNSTKPSMKLTVAQDVVPVSPLTWKLYTMSDDAKNMVSTKEGLETLKGITKLLGCTVASYKCSTTDNPAVIMFRNAKLTDDMKDSVGMCSLY